MTKPAATRRGGTARCAIYTRKSSEEGLEQESTRPGGFGLEDIWVSERDTVDDLWGPPQNLKCGNTSWPHR